MGVGVSSYYGKKSYKLPNQSTEGAGDPQNWSKITLSGGQRNNLEALDPANGHLLWARGIPVGSSLLEISHGTVFLLTLNSTGNNSLFALSLADGYQPWSTDYPKQILAVAIGS